MKQPKKNIVRYLRIITNNTCNLNCYYCHGEGVSCEKDDTYKLSIKEYSELLKLFYELNFTKFKICGGEPSLNPSVPLIIKSIRELSPKIDISMISNGHLVLSNLDRYMNSGINRINISLHAFNSERYLTKINGTMEELKRTKDTIIILHKKGLLSKINYVLVRGDNEDEFLQMLLWASHNKLTVNVLNLLSSSETTNDLKSRTFSYDEIFTIIANNFNILNLKTTPSIESLDMTTIQLEEGAIVKFKDQPLNKNQPFSSCRKCSQLEHCIEGTRAIRLTVDGNIKPCMLRSDNIFPLLDIYKENKRESTFRYLKQYLENL